MPDAAAVADRMDLAAENRDNPFLVESGLEIAHLLSALMREAALITVNVDAYDFFLTSVVAVDSDAGCVYLERGRGKLRPVQELNNRRLAYSTTLDKVKIRFTCTGIEAVSYAGSEAYRIPLPLELMRIQRREFYRVPAPMGTPVKCRLSADDNTTDAIVELHLSDISCGGISVQAPPALFTPELGACYACTLLLPDTSGLRVQVQARNAHMVTLRNGKIVQRSGFAYVKPAASTLAGIQRYILRLERQRRAHAGRIG